MFFKRLNGKCQFKEAEVKPHVFYVSSRSLEMRTLKDISLVGLFVVFLVNIGCNLEKVETTGLPPECISVTNGTSLEESKTKWLNLAVDEARLIKDVHLQFTFLRRIAGLQAHAANLTGAMTTTQFIADVDKRGWAYSTIAKAQAQNGDFTGAKATADFVRSNRRHYSNILKSVAEAGGIDESEDMSIVHDNPHYRAHANFYIARACAETGNLNKAITLADGQSSPNPSSQACFKSMIYASIAKAYAKVGNWEGYQESIRLAKTFAKSVTVDQRANTYYQIVKAQVNVQDFTGAKQTADIIPFDKVSYPDELISSGAVSDSRYRSLAYKAIVIGLCNAGDINGAKLVAGGMTTSNLKDSAYLAIVKVLINLGDLTGATDSTRRIPGEDARSWALREIAIARGDFKAAMNIANSIEKSDVKSFAYQQIASAQARAGNLNDYRKTIRIAIVLVKTYQDPYKRGPDKWTDTINPRSVSVLPRKPLLFNSIIKVQADVGDFEGAAATATLISDYGFGGEVRYSAFQYLAKAITQAGQIAYLQNWINSLPEPADRTAALLGAAIASDPKRIEPCVLKSKPELYRFSFQLR